LVFPVYMVSKLSERGPNDYSMVSIAMEIPGQGTFAIYILGGIGHGLWED